MSVLSRLRCVAAEVSPGMRRVIDVLEQEGAEYTLTDGQVDIEDVGGSDEFAETAREKFLSNQLYVQGRILVV